MSTKYNRIIKAIVIHHMGDNQPSIVPIAKRWNPYNYDYPEYDFGVEFDGTIRQGRPLNYKGSHTKSDKPPYSTNYGTWWFNENAIGIGIAGDFTKYPMPQAQFNGLVELVKKLMNQYNLTLDNVYPHMQLSYTLCPGCTYSKIFESQGSWSYDEFENAVLESKQENNNQGDEFSMEKCIVYFTPADFSNALILANKFGGCAMFCRNGSANVHADAMKSNVVFTVGGPKLNVNGEIYLSGDSAKDTLIAVSEYLKNN